MYLDNPSWVRSIFLKYVLLSTCDAEPISNHLQWNTLTKSEVAEMLHCTTKTIERMINDGRFPNGRKRVGHKTLYWTLYDVKQYSNSTKSCK